MKIPLLVYVVSLIFGAYSVVQSGGCCTGREVGMAVLSLAVRVKMGTRGTREEVPVHPCGPKWMLHELVNGTTLKRMN